MQTKANQGRNQPTATSFDVPKSGNMKSSLLQKHSRFFFTLISITTLSFLALSIGVTSPSDAAIAFFGGQLPEVDCLQHRPDSGQVGSIAVAPAPAKCPEGCVCMTPEEAATAGYQLCQDKQILCGYDQYQNPMYCYEEPAAAGAPVECPEGCICVTTEEAAGKAFELCQGIQIVCGYDEYGNPMYCYEEPPPLPDLYIRSVGLTILGGGRYGVTYEIQNVRYGPAPSSRTGLYVDDVLVDYDDVGPLAPSEQSEEEFSFVYDLSSCTGDSDTIRIVADYADEIAETDNGNNEESRTLECPETPGPDLHIMTVWTEPLGGSEHRIGYRIENLGVGSAPSSRTGLYVDDVRVDYDDVGPLTSLERSEEEFSFIYDLSSCTGDSDTIRIVADYADDIDETNEGNNEDSLVWECPERAKPDLVILSVWWQSEPGSLQNLSLHYSIENRSLAAAGPSVTRLWINDVRIATSSVPELEGGEVLGMVTFSERWTPMLNDNHVEIWADDSNNVEESPAGEGNNGLEVDWTFELSCFDGFQSRDEEGIDCGGSHCPPCNRCELTTLPSRFDWRDYYTFPPIRSQTVRVWVGTVEEVYSCGSCWAHAAIGAIEGTYIVQCGVVTDLSEQHAICEVSGDCSGGCPHDVLRYARDHGIVDENCWPYLARNSPCDKCSDWRDRLWRIHEYHRVSSDIEEMKRTLICYGPLSVGSESWEHAVVVVGYDDNVALPPYSPGCWIIRNSHGIGYGNDLDGDGLKDDPGYGLIPYSGYSHSDIKNYAHYVIGVIPP